MIVTRMATSRLIFREASTPGTMVAHSYQRNVKAVGRGFGQNHCCAIDHRQSTAKGPTMKTPNTVVTAVLVKIPSMTRA
jgi:hypothetical protein